MRYFVLNYIYKDGAPHIIHGGIGVVYGRSDVSVCAVYFDRCVVPLIICRRRGAIVDSDEDDFNRHDVGDDDLVPSTKSVRISDPIGGRGDFDGSVRFVFMFSLRSLRVPWLTLTLTLKGF